MTEIIQFPVRRPVPENLREIPDVPANHERDGQGPPIGSTAWCCECGCFAFYLTAIDTRCYDCHEPQVFP